MNIKEIFELLICIGSNIERNMTPSEQSVSSLKPYRQINLIKRDYIIAAHSLSDLELIALLKGLTYVEGKLNWSGGSVATGKYLFGCLIQRNLKAETIDEISNWLLCNSHNHFWGPKDPTNNFYLG